jgi:transcriptional regulator with XRE-family HTH domain
MTPSTLGEQIGRIRRQRQLSQSQLAALSGVDRTAIVKVESGTYRGMYWSAIRALAKALDTSMDCLCGRDVPDEQFIDRRRHGRGARLLG